MLALGRAVIAGSLAATLAVSAQESASPIDRAFRTFWAAPHAASAAERIDPILKTGVSFEDALTRVRHGRAYEADVPRGLQFGRHRTFDGIDHEYAFVIPKDYDPSRPYQVRFQLHGGIARARPPVVNRIRVDALPSGVEEIAVFPGGWVRSLWWSATQVDNLARILDRLKRTYNIDENRVYLTGISDGGTGVYYMAFRDPTPWASFLPLIGNMVVLGTPAVRAEGEIYPGNAVNKPFYVVNTGRDRLYPAHVSGAVRGSSAEARRPRGVPCVSGAGPFDGVVAERAPGARVVRARSSARAAAGRDLVADRAGRSVQPRALARHRSAWIRSTARAGCPTRNLLRRGRELDFGLRINSAVDRGRRAHEVVAGSNAFRIGLRAGDRFVEVNGTTVETGRDIAQEMAAVGQQGDRLRFVVERAGDRMVLEGVVRARRGRTAAGADLPAAQAVGARRSRAARKCRGGVDRRRESIYAAALAVDLRLPAPDHGRGEWAHGVRGHGRAERGDAAEVGRARQRPDDGVRGRAEYRTGK